MSNWLITGIRDTKSEKIIGIKKIFKETEHFLSKFSFVLSN